MCTKTFKAHFLKGGLLSHCSSNVVDDIPIYSSESLLLSNVKFCYIRLNGAGRKYSETNRQTKHLNNVLVMQDLQVHR